MGPEMGNLCGLEPQLIKLEFIIYLPKLKVSRACRPYYPLSFLKNTRISPIWAPNLRNMAVNSVERAPTLG